MRMLLLSEPRVSLSKNKRALVKVKWLLAALTCAAFLTACGGSSNQPVLTSTLPPASPTPDHRVDEYRASLVQTISDFSQSYSVMLVLLNNPKVTDSDWKASVEKNTGEIKRSDMAIRQMDPPACAKAFHDQLALATKTMDMGVDALRDGIETRSSTRLSEAQGYLNAASPAFNKAIDALNSSSCRLSQ